MDFWVKHRSKKNGSRSTTTIEATTLGTLNGYFTIVINSWDPQSILSEAEKLGMHPSKKVFKVWHPYSKRSRIWVKLMSVLCVNSNMKATTQRELKMHWFSFGPNTPSTVFFVRDDVTSERIEIKYRNPSRIIFFSLLVFAICYSYYIGSSSPSLLVKFPSCHHYCCLNPNLYIPPKTTKKI